MNPNKKNMITKPYLAEINKLRDQITFYKFDNNKEYSFDYQYKDQFDKILKEIKEQKNISPIVTNKIPIFLSKEVERIAFFKYTSKSVRVVDISNLREILTKQAIKYKKEKKDECEKDECEKNRSTNEESIDIDTNIDISTLVDNDMKIFGEYQEKNNFKEYRLDITAQAIQFNAYDKDDNLLIEKSFVRGGLIFDMTPLEFEDINISYPRYRKKRSDIKNNYLPLKLIKIRPLISNIS